MDQDFISGVATGVVIGNALCAAFAYALIRIHHIEKRDGHLRNVPFRYYLTVLFSLGMASIGLILN